MSDAAHVLSPCAPVLRASALLCHFCSSLQISQWTALLSCQATRSRLLNVCSLRDNQLPRLVRITTSVFAPGVKQLLLKCRRLYIRPIQPIVNIALEAAPSKVLRNMSSRPPHPTRTPITSYHSRTAYVVPPAQAEAIVRVTAYHPKDFDLAVMWLPPREHARIAVLRWNGCLMFAI